MIIGASTHSMKMISLKQEIIFSSCEEKVTYCKRIGDINVETIVIVNLPLRFLVVPRFSFDYVNFFFKERKGTRK